MVQATEGNPQDAGALSRRRASARQDLRELIPPLGLREYWYPALEDRRVRSKLNRFQDARRSDVVLPREGWRSESARQHVHPSGRQPDARRLSLRRNDLVPVPRWTDGGEGNVLAVLPEGPDSKIPGKVRIRAYPTKTLRGMVFVWMGDGEPARLEEDIPPEFFHDRGVMLYAREIWPVNWRAALENGGDAHAPYVHRDAVKTILMDSLASYGPAPVRSRVTNDRAATFGYQWTPGTGGDGGGLRRAARPRVRRPFSPPLGGTWPKHWRRGTIAWATRWSGRRRRSRHVEADPEWAGMMHHLPAMTRMDDGTHEYTRVCVPIDEELTRHVYFHWSPVENAVGQLYEKLNFHLWHRWYMYNDFSAQDARAIGSQRYDTTEYLSATDSHVLLLRRMVLQAQGMAELEEDTHLPTPAEEFSLERQKEAGADLEWTPRR